MLLQEVEVVVVVVVVVMVEVQVEDVVIAEVEVDFWLRSLRSRWSWPVTSTLSSPTRWRHSVCPQ